MTPPLVCLVSRFPTIGYLRVWVKPCDLLPYAMSMASLGALFVGATHHSCTWIWHRTEDPCPSCGLWHDRFDYPGGCCGGTIGACDRCGNKRELEWDEVAGAKFCTACAYKTEAERCAAW